MRRRVVCGLSETIATLPPQSAFTSVDLPTFGRPATATKPDFTGARTSPAAARPACTLTISPSRVPETTRSKRNSYSHWRQPPQGEAVIAIASRSPGLQPSRDRARDRGPLRADPERIGGVLDVQPSKTARRASARARADEEVRVRRVGALSHRVRRSYELVGRHVRTAGTRRASRARRAAPP